MKDNFSNKENQGNSFKPDGSLHLDKKIYSKSSIIRTCYALSEAAHYWLKVGEEAFIVDIAKIKPEDNIEKIKNNFVRSLIDFSLREEIEGKTKLIRETIILAALSELKGHQKDI